MSVIPEHLERLVVNSFPSIDNFFGKYEVEFVYLENARSFWSECYRVLIEPLSDEYQPVSSPLFIKIPKISETNNALDADNDQENTAILIKLSNRESEFFDAFRHTNFLNFPIPHNYNSELLSTENTGGLVFDDIGKTTKTLDFIPGYNDHQIKQLMDALAGFHSTVLQQSDTINWDRFNNELYDAEYINMLYRDTLDFENICPDEMKGRISKIEWIFNVDSVEQARQYDMNNGMPEVLSHNDMNASNILWNLETTRIVGIIDFQHVARGSAVFDIIRILQLGLSAKERKDKQKQYLKYYHDSLTNFCGGIEPFSFRSCEITYDLHYPFVSATTLFGCYYYYKMYKDETITIDGDRNAHAKEILNRAIAICDELDAY